MAFKADHKVPQTERLLMLYIKGPIKTRRMQHKVLASPGCKYIELNHTQQSTYSDIRMHIHASIYTRTYGMYVNIFRTDMYIIIHEKVHTLLRLPGYITVIPCVFSRFVQSISQSLSRLLRSDNLIIIWYTQGQQWACYNKAPPTANYNI